MNQVLAPPAVVLSAILPPYHRLEPLSLRVPEARLPRGSVLSLGISTEAGWSGMGDAISSLRTRHPEAPLVLQVERLSTAALLAAPRAVRLGARGIIVADAPLRPQLEAMLAHPPAPGVEVVEWLALRGMPLSPTVARIVREMFDQAGAQPRVSRLLARLGETEITVRHRFRKRGIAPPVRWMRTARGLHAALCIQAEPDRPLERLALGMGLADHSALSQLLWRAFRLRPGAIRGTLGWEWILDCAYPSLLRFTPQ